MVRLLFLSEVFPNPALQAMQISLTRNFPDFAAIFDLDFFRIRSFPYNCWNIIYQNKIDKKPEISDAG